MAATRSPTESNFILRCYVQGSRLQFAVQSSTASAIIIEVTKACGDSQWHHVAACRDVEGSATTLTLFWDGQLIGSKAGATTAIGPRTSVVFGGVNYAADGLGGQIDEVRISSAVRYVTNFTPQRRLESDVNTTALFHFDETSGTAFTSVQGHTGTLSGSAAWQTDTGYLSGYCASEAASCADGSIELGRSAWGRADIVFCRTSTLQMPDAAATACGSDSHLCSSAELVNRNDGFVPPAGLRMQATLLESGCLATHYDPVSEGHDLRSDLVRGDTPMTSVCPGALGTPWGRQWGPGYYGGNGAWGLTGALCCR